MKKLFLIFFSTCFINLFAQENKLNAFFVDYTFQVPQLNLKESFGANSAIGISYILEKNNNIFFGVELDYMFGSNIKDSTVLSMISTENGSIIASDGGFANVLLYQRGFNSHAFIGYAFHLQENQKSGLYISTGLGYLEHKIRIETRNEDLPQLSDEYKKGYDRFTNGLSSKTAIDYIYISKKGNFQFLVGYEIIYAFTKNRRDYLFNEMQYTDKNLRKDMLLGFRAGVIIPINRKNSGEFHYF